uniref:Uncharacterized protein n=1 Tax=Toxoplasma gondii (strain ATCC 50861 / VEG) TaxID=432359 RepID=A0A0F7V6U4_TOXGV|nr:TPA: hypothetical protein BN1205_081525 [Toxoplasma gondii VEG]
MLNDDNPDLSMLELICGRFGESEHDADERKAFDDADRATVLDAAARNSGVDTKNTSSSGAEDRQRRTQSSEGAGIGRRGGARRLSSASKLTEQSGERTRHHRSGSQSDIVKHQISNSTDAKTLVEVGIHGAELPASSPSSLASSRCSVTSLSDRASEGRIQDGPDGPVTRAHHRATSGIYQKKYFTRNNIHPASVKHASDEVVGSHSLHLSSSVPKLARSVGPASKRGLANPAIGETDGGSFSRVQPPPHPSPPVLPPTVVSGCPPAGRPVLDLTQEISTRPRSTPFQEWDDTCRWNVTPSPVACIKAPRVDDICNLTGARSDMSRMPLRFDPEKAFRSNGERLPKGCLRHGSDWRQHRITQVDSALCDNSYEKGGAQFSPVYKDRLRGTPRRWSGKPRQRGALPSRSYMNISVKPGERDGTNIMRRMSNVKGKNGVHRDHRDGFDCESPSKLQMAACRSEGHPLDVTRLQPGKRESRTHRSRVRRGIVRSSCL